MWMVKYSKITWKIWKIIKNVVSDKKMETLIT